MEQLITLEILFFSSLGSIVSFSYGAIVGSFLNVVILRLPSGERSIVFPPSRCPQCETHIRWYDNIPILSFFCLLGKCRYCKTKISFQYPLVELATALLSLALYTKFGLSFEYFFYFLFVGSLLAIIFIDIAHQIIPDIISLPGIVIGFAGSFFCDVVTWQQSGLGILLGGGVAANNKLRTSLQQMCDSDVPPKKLLVAPKRYCTDNAVMVASLAYYKFRAGLFADLTLEPKAHSE